jgi:hypothetical protein
MLDFIRHRYSLLRLRIEGTFTYTELYYNPTTRHRLCEISNRLTLINPYPANVENMASCE